MTEKTAQPLDPGQAENRPKDSTNKRSRQAVQKWDYRSSEQQQRRRYRHQQQVLHHVSREHLVIEHAQRRADSDPDGQ
jgi:hypothetical protein